MDKIIVSLAGSCGNQMFSYAFGYALANEKKCKLCIETTNQDCGITRSYELDNLKIKYEKRISWSYKQGIFDKIILNRIKRLYSIGLCTDIYKEKRPTVFEPEVFSIKQNTYFVGNWQSEKYFINYRNELLKLLEPKQISDETKRFAEEMKSVNSISLHVRRGDYLQAGCALSMDYYDKAIQYIIGKIENPVFFVFSDDLSFCKDYLSKFDAVDIRYPEIKMLNPVIEDMYLMSQCKHNIIANSSYSWWGAWLNQNPTKFVVCPELDMWTGDFYPDKWHNIKAKKQ